MKYRSPRNRVPNLMGFTLIELLAVMVIIAILAAALTVAAGKAINAAKRAQAQNMASQIQTACMSYYTEYSVYPIPSTATASADYFVSDASGTSDWKQITEALSGNISPYNGTSGLTPTVSNTRSIAFLTLKKTDVDLNDCPVNPLSVDSVNHPYFNMAIDGDYSNIIGDSGSIPTTIALSNCAMPNFSTSTTGTINPLAKTAGGITVWANCNITTTTTKWNPAWFVHAGF